MATNIQQLLGDKAESLLGFNSPKVPKERLHLPGPDWVDRIFMQSDRNNRVLGNLEWMYSHGRLGGTGYLSILPVDQGIEHSAGASFAKNPDYFDQFYFSCRMRDRARNIARRACRSRPVRRVCFR